MKKVTLLAAVAIAFSFASCKKDYTCTCTTTWTGSSLSVTSTTVYKKASKSSVKAACASIDYKDEDTGAIEGTRSCSFSK